MILDPIDYVAWYHDKFRSTYHHLAFPEMIHDHRVLISLIFGYNIQTICEIGTWNGDTALMLWLYPRIKRVKCIDIHKDMGVDFDQVNHALRVRAEYGHMFKNTFVELMFADTMKYAKGNENHDMVFIDGAHDYEHVRNDAELAYSWEPKVIAFHDYHNGNIGVDKFIDEQIEIGQKFLQFKNSCIAAIVL